jgi:hypothetical protein
MPFKVLSFPVVLLACCSYLNYLPHIFHLILIETFSVFLLAYASPIPAALSPSAFGRDNVVAVGGLLHGFCTLLNKSPCSAGQEA